MPKLGRKAGWLAAVLLVAAITVFAGWRDYTKPGPLVAEKVVVIAKGASLREVTPIADRGGRHRRIPVSSSPATYRPRPRPRSQAGEYEFAAGDQPARGRRPDRQRQGRAAPSHRPRRAHQRRGGGAASMPRRRSTGTIDAEPPEGSLLPDTYFYVRGNTRQELLNRMRRAMDQALAEAWAKRAPGLPLESPARGADPGLDRREGDGAPGRARPHRRRLYRSG